MFKATLYKIEGERMIETAMATDPDSQAAANRSAARSANLGWGGHGRSERDLDRIARGHTVVAPLGTWKIEEGYGDRS